MIARYDDGHAGQHGAEGRDQLVHQAVGAGDHGRDIPAASVQLRVDDVGHEGCGSRGDAHLGTVQGQVDEDVKDHCRAH